MAKHRIIFRAHDGTPHLNRFPRPFGLDKPTLVRISFLSLMEGLPAGAAPVHVIGDRLSPESLRFFWSFGNVELINEELGAVGSYQRALEIAFDADDDEWVYLCEDDYLHRPEWFSYLDDLVDHRSEYLAYHPKPRWRRLRTTAIERKPLFVFLADYPDRYQAKRRRSSFVFHSKYCHWRQITSTTLTMIGQARELRRRRRTLEACAERLDDGRMSRKLYADLSFFGRGLCVSPMPGLSSHMHEGTMSVLGDWRTLSDQYMARLVGPGRARA